MLQTETRKTREEQCKAYIAKHIINKELEWLIECGEIRESIYFRGATGDRYTTYSAVKRNQNIIDFYSSYINYGHGAYKGNHIAILRGYVLEMVTGGNKWWDGCGYTLKQLMRQGVISKNTPWKIRWCRSAHFLRLHDKTEFSPWYGMKIDLKSGTLTNKPNRRSAKDYKTAKDTDSRIRKANYISNKHNREAINRYRKAGGDTSLARDGWSNGRWQPAVGGEGTEKINWDMIPMDDMFKHRNATLRSNILEHYGINAVLETLKYDVVDIDFIDGREYKLLNVVIPDNSVADRREEACLYLQMINPSTGESHFEGIANVGQWNAPREATVKEALSWRDGDREMMRTHTVIPLKDDKDVVYIKPITLT